MLVFVGVLVAVGDDRAEATTGLASWYGTGFAGSPTASGDVFDPEGFTAVHKTLPFGTQLTVSYRGRSTQVVVNDRGPYSGGRDLDLSQGAAEYLGLTRAGVAPVDYSVTGRGGYGVRQAHDGIRRAAAYGADQARDHRVHRACRMGERRGSDQRRRRILLRGATRGHDVGDLGGARHHREPSRCRQRHSQLRRHLGRAEDLLLIQDPLQESPVD